MKDVSTFTIGDGAMLIHDLLKAAEKPKFTVSFMPHHRIVKHGDWKGLCESSSIHYLDPTAAVETTLKEIRQSALVISEAMHSAIVDDALRIPWIPVRSALHKHCPSQAHPWERNGRTPDTARVEGQAQPGPARIKLA